MTAVTEHFEDYRDKGRNGRRYYEEHFMLERFMQDMEKLLQRNIRME